MVSTANLHPYNMDFVSLESNLFSLAQKDTYVALNDPSANDRDVEAAVGAIVSGLFSVLATLGVVPVIRCPKVGRCKLTLEG